MNHEVVIENHSFNPPAITIAAGDSVTWQNRDTVRHTATRTEEPQFDTGFISPGVASSPIEFSTPTEERGIDYFCRPHPFMQGTIIVI
jgi:plastocyanin